jgi:hypothetical protein
LRPRWMAFLNILHDALCRLDFNLHQIFTIAC